MNHFVVIFYTYSGIVAWILLCLTRSIDAQRIELNVKLAPPSIGDNPCLSNLTISKARRPLQKRRPPLQSNSHPALADTSSRADSHRYNANV